MLASLIRASLRPLPLMRLFSSYPPHEVLGMPLLSPTMSTGTIVKWLKKEGEKLKPGEILFEVETDKATLGYEVQDEIILAKILETEGAADLPLGHPVAVLVEDEEDVGKFSDFKVSGAPVQEEAKASSPSGEQNQQSQQQPTGDIRISPSASTLLHHYGLDASKITPSGPMNVLQKTDVLAYLESNPTSAKAQPKQPQEPTQAPKPQKQGKINVSVPRFSVIIDCNIEKLKGFLNGQSLKAAVLKAAAVTCQIIPEANSLWLDKATRLYDYVDFSINLEGQQYFVQDAQAKRVSQIASDLEAPASGTPTFGVTFGPFKSVHTPTYSCQLFVQNPHQDLSANPENPVVQEKLTAVLNCDHRVVDGAVGANWLQKFKELIENPSLLIQQGYDVVKQQNGEEGT